MHCATVGCCAHTLCLPSANLSTYSNCNLRDPFNPLDPTNTAGMLGSPESPGYLAAKGKRDEAVAVATKLWGAGGASQLGESAGELLNVVAADADAPSAAAAAYGWEQHVWVGGCESAHDWTPLAVTRGSRVRHEQLELLQGAGSHSAWLLTFRLSPAHLSKQTPPCLAGGKGGGSSSAAGESLFSATYRKGVIMGCLLFVFQQFSGINAIVYFSSSVFKQVRGCVCLGGG